MSKTDPGGRHWSPLQETLDFIDPEEYYFDLALGPSEEAYETVDSLTRDGGASLARQMGLARAKWGLSNRDSALFMVGTYAWRVGGPAIACYVLSRRVPDISPENVALAFDGDGGVSEVALLRGKFAVLPSDAAAGHPDAIVLDSELEMLGWMRERLVAGIEPLLETVRERARLSRHTAWRGISDYVSDAFLMVGWDTEDQAGHAADARAFLTTLGSPLKASTGFFVVEDEGRRGAYLTRGVCCQAYKDPEHGHCDSCPLLSQEERERRASEDLAARETTRRIG